MRFNCTGRVIYNTHLREMVTHWPQISAVDIHVHCSIKMTGYSDYVPYL